MLINVEFFSLWQHKKRNSMICMMNDSKAFLVRNVKHFASWMVMNWRSTGKWQNNLRYVIWVISFHRHFSSKLIKAHCEPRFQHSIKENIFSAENCMSAASFCNLIICQTKWKQPFFMFDSSTINRSLPTTRNVVAQAMNCIGQTTKGERGRTAMNFRILFAICLSMSECLYFNSTCCMDAFWLSLLSALACLFRNA